MRRPGYEIYSLTTAVLSALRGRPLLVTLLHLLMKLGEFGLLLGRQHRIDLREELRMCHLKLHVEVGTRLRRRTHGRLVERAAVQCFERAAGASLSELLLETLRALLKALVDLLNLRLRRVGQVELLGEVAERAAAGAAPAPRPAVTTGATGPM